MADPADLDALLEQLADDERRLQLTHFTNDDALALGFALVEAARAELAPVTIDIRRGSQQLFHAALPGTSPDNDEWIKRKINVVNRFGHSSFYVGTFLRKRGKTMEEVYLLDSREFGAHGGCFPILIADVGPVGTVAVSGLPQADDHRMVVTALEGLLAAG